MQFSVIFLLVLFSVVAVLSIPLKEVNRQRRESNMSEKRQQKARSGYIRFGKRADPNAELLYLDQLLL